MSITTSVPSTPLAIAKDFNAFRTSVSRRLTYDNLESDLKVTLLGQRSKIAVEIAIADFSGSLLISHDSLVDGDYRLNKQLAIPVQVKSITDIENDECEAIVSVAPVGPCICYIDEVSKVTDATNPSLFMYKASSPTYVSPQLFSPEEMTDALRNLLNASSKYISLSGPASISMLNGPLQSYCNDDRIEEAYNACRAAADMHAYADLTAALLSAVHTLAMSATIDGYLKSKDLLAVVTAEGFVDSAEKLTKILDEISSGIVLSEDSSINDILAEISEEHHSGIKRRAISKIQAELGDEGSDEMIADKYREKLEELKAAKIITDDTAKVLDRSITRFAAASPMSQDKDVQRTYLDFVIFDVPWNITTKERADFSEVETLLEESHHGLKDPKKAIMHYLAARRLCSKEGRDQRSAAILLVGPPGIGKTSLAKAVGEAMGRKTVRISLGGVHDESEIRGHRRTYVGAMPGRIMSGISRAGANNCVFVIDEADKTATSSHGNPQDALLEVIDPEQNDVFKDHYMDIEYDLSEVLFILTANELEQISPPLADRCEVIHLHSYTHQEKMEIAKGFLLPRQIEHSGINEADIDFSEGWVDYIIQAYTEEPGVRSLERSIGNICKDVATKKLKEESSFKPITVNKTLIHDELGPPQHTPTSPIWAVIEDTPGTTNYMAWTGNGGKIGQLQVQESFNSEDKTDTITGNIKDVMKESVAVAKHAAVTVVKNIEDEVRPLDFSTEMLHIHFCEGGIPKDGPSAGVPITMAIVSHWLKVPLNKEIAATGEISLDGTITKIGGVREKITAAVASRITEVFLPLDNQADFENLPKDLRDKIKVNYISNVSELFPATLLPNVTTGGAPLATK